MSDRNDFDMYFKINDQKPKRKKNLSPNKEEFGSEEKFEKGNSNNVESFSDWVDKMLKEHDK